MNTVSYTKNVEDDVWKAADMLDGMVAGVCGRQRVIEPTQPRFTGRDDPIDLRPCRRGRYRMQHAEISPSILNAGSG